ncbi:MAG: UvrD-helicase domain-containing protein, partial [Nitriliruptoraceae bacterium]
MTDRDPTTDGHRFDLGGPLPHGTLVLRASAGTGKTFAIAALATRAIAEGRVTLPELLIVTFTRAATAELGDRVRRRLVEAAGHLEARLAGTAAPTDDPVLLALERGADDAELHRRAARLTTAVTSFDAATITTIHSFCQQALRGVGLSGEDADAVVIEDQTELIEQVVSDALVARFHDTGGAPPHREVVAAVRAAVAAPDAVIVPEQPPHDDDHLLAADDPDARGRLIADLAREARVELARRKRAAGLRSQDDLLTGLHAALSDPVHGPRAVAALRERYRIALIDEFQDTDPVQWAILSELFTRDGASDGGRDDGRALVLIGDPKQAIYGFRGADVRAYLDATDAAGQLATLADNHRSDRRLVAALDRLLHGTVYGDPRITHAPSSSPPRLHGTALDGPRADPLELRVVTDTPDGQKLGSGTAMPTLIADVAAEVVRTLDEVTLHGRSAEPRDIAVLTRSNDDALAVQSALRAVAVPAVINSVGSVLETDAARQWQQLLDALQRPANPGTARAAAITDLLGWDAATLAAADDHDLDALHAELHRLAGVLQRRGVAALRRELERTGAAARVLASVDGDRQLTDLEHVAELLHGAQLDGELSPAALAAWLRRRAADAAEGLTPPEEQTRRLESDADAVQVLTIHRSKGLEFGIVLAPFLWKQPPGVSPPVTVHPDAGRVVDVGPKDRSGFDHAKQLKRDDDQGEQLRLLYVALTRARHRVVVWWLPIDSAGRSALAAVLHARDEHDRVRSDQLPIDRISPADSVTALTPLLERCGGTLSQVPPSPDTAPYASRTDDATPLSRAIIDGRIDTAWRRSSYSGLVRLIDRSEDATADAATDDLAAEAAVTDDERLVDAGPVSPADDDAATQGELDGPELAMGTVCGGADLGTMLHAVLEHADMSAADLHGELAHHLA